MAIDIFESYREEDYPPYAVYIMTEAEGDLELADLIERREILFDDVGAKGGFNNLEIEEIEPTQEYLMSLYEQISARKEKLGLHRFGH